MAGAALAVAGAMIQAVCRNPLAEPGILGVTGGAGFGAILVITLAPAAGIWSIARWICSPSTTTRPGSSAFRWTGRARCCSASRAC